MVKLPKAKQITVEKQTLIDAFKTHEASIKKLGFEHLSDSTPVPVSGIGTLLKPFIIMEKAFAKAINELEKRIT